MDLKFTIVLDINNFISAVLRSIPALSSGGPGLKFRSGDSLF
jgi:hypothetical protein